LAAAAADWVQRAVLSVRTIPLTLQISRVVGLTLSSTMTGKFSSRQWAVVMFKGFYRQIFCLIANKAVCQAMTIAVPRVNAQRQYFFNISVKVCDLIVSIICTLKQYLVDWSLVAGLISLREVPTYSNSCVVSFTRCDNPAGR